MPIIVEMPRMSDTMEEGTLIKWLCKEGDAVSAGDVLADIETDKATQELAAFDDGTVAKLVVEEGATLEVGSAILILAEEDESVEDAIAAAGDLTAAGSSSNESVQTSAAGGDSDSSSATATAVAQAPVAAPVPTHTGRVLVSPLARKMAEDQGLDLNAITGTGPGGRIIKRDILAAGSGSTPSAPTASAPITASASTGIVPQSVSLEAKMIPVNNMRKTIARRLSESKTTIPHFAVTVSVNLDPLLELRAQVNPTLEARGTKLSVNDFLVRATALALVQHPVINSSWTDQGGQQPSTVNIGVAVALPEEKGGGLVVPTLRDAHNLPLPTISSETKRLAKKARDAGLSIEDMSDGTFTISNLGMFGVDHFEAIINPPQGAILAIGAGMKKPVVRDGEIVVGTEMTLTLSSDHRVIDGAAAAIFLQTLKDLVERPGALLV